MRPHIEFIHSNDMPWQPHPVGAARTDVKHKMLSIDDTSHEMSVLIQYPAGWSRNTGERLSVDEEIFVLEGELQIGGIRYDEGCYAHLPAGYVREPSSESPNGAVVLTFYSGKPSSADDNIRYDAARLVTKIALYEEGWDSDYVGINSPEIAGSGSRKKLLRTDPDNGDQTWIMGIIPSYQETKVESHPVVQECFMISGDMAGNLGLLVKGSYFWRPRDILHGPYGTKTGCTILSRSKGGSLVVDYYDLAEPFSFNATHRVSVPEELVVYSQEKFPEKRY